MKADGAIPALGTSAVRTAHRDVTDRLRQAIVSGQLPAGTHLVQAELAASLQVSVTPVREALRELESQGLVDSDPFRGATVHEVSLEELAEVYELRRMLIPLAIRERVTTITDAELQEAARLLRRMTLSISDTQWVEDNRTLHRLLDGVSTRANLRAILRRLSDVSSLYVNLSVTTDPERRKRAKRDHQELVEAYRTRDPDRVCAVTLRHIADTEAVARAALAERG